MKIELSGKQIILVITIVGSISSIATLFVTSIKNNINSTSENAQNIISDGTLTINNGTDVSKLLEAVNDGDPNLSEEQYNQLQPGITYEEAIKIVGSKGVEAATSGDVKIYTWGTRFYVHLSLTFVKGKLDSKSYSGSR